MERLQAIKDYVLQALTDPGVIRGLIYIIGGGGAFADPDRAMAYVALSQVVAGAIHVGFRAKS